MVRSPSPAMPVMGRISLLWNNIAVTGAHVILLFGRRAKRCQTGSNDEMSQLSSSFVSVTNTLLDVIVGSGFSELVVV